MHVCVFLDLDDTLFQTLPKCPPGQEVRPIAFRKDGAPLSFMSGRQEALLDLLQKSATVIPVTARNLDAFRRVRLPFRAAAILDFGGVILRPDGALDADWDEQIRPRVLAHADDLESLRAAVQAFSDRHGLGVRARVIADFAMPLYLVMKHPEYQVAALDRLRLDFLPTQQLGPFFVHANGNNLSVVPRVLGKERAVRHVIDHYFQGDSVMTLGVGDSLSDGPFLRMCDYWLTPQGSQLAEVLTGWLERRPEA